MASPHAEPSVGLLHTWQHARMVHHESEVHTAVHARVLVANLIVQQIMLICESHEQSENSFCLNYSVL